MKKDSLTKYDIIQNFMMYSAVRSILFMDIYLWKLRIRLSI